MPSPSRLFSITATLGLLLGCGSTSTSELIPDAATLIAIDPANFPELACEETGSDAAAGNAGGSSDLTRKFGAYVAELIDVSGALALDSDVKLKDFVLQASPPVRCDRSVAFGRVTPLREYRVRVHVYRESVEELCAVAPGTSVVVRRDENGECGSVAVAPVARLTCDGWRELARGSSDGTGGAGAGDSPEASPGGMAGAAATSTNDPSANGPASGDRGAAGSPSVVTEDTLGRPGISIDYQTVTLKYCFTSG